MNNVAVMNNDQQLYIITFKDSYLRYVLESFAAYSDLLELWVLVWPYHHQAYVYALEIIG